MLTACCLIERRALGAPHHFLLLAHVSLLSFSTCSHLLSSLSSLSFRTSSDRHRTVSTTVASHLRVLGEMSSKGEDKRVVAGRRTTTARVTRSRRGVRAVRKKPDTQKKKGKRARELSLPFKDTVARLLFLSRRGCIYMTSCTAVLKEKTKRVAQNEQGGQLQGRVRIRPSAVSAARVSRLLSTATFDGYKTDLCRHRATNWLRSRTYKLSHIARSQHLSVAPPSPWSIRPRSLGL
jgi:hypothetical protein